MDDIEQMMQELKEVGCTDQQIAERREFYTLLFSLPLADQMQMEDDFIAMFGTAPTIH